MLTPEQEAYVRDHAYIPEHTVGLMVHLSGGDACLCDDCLCFLRRSWLVVVGYPLSRQADPKGLEAMISRLADRYSLRRVSLIAEELPDALLPRVYDRQSDAYFTMAADEPELPATVRRNLGNARRRLTLDRADCMEKEHVELFGAFLKRSAPSQRVYTLIERLPAYVAATTSALVLNARNHKGRLNACYVVDLSTATFANYIIGCYSKSDYVRGASDLLMWETLRVARQNNKRLLHLGLGVNDGVRRFKEKWGASPTLAYEMAELHVGKPSLWEVFKDLRKPS